MERISRCKFPAGIIFLLFILITGIPGFHCVFAQPSLNQVDSRGQKQGLWQKNYSNGNLMYRGAFKDNKPVGEWKRYHEEGGLKAILQYSETSDSVKARLYETASHPVAEGTYLREKKEGIWLYYSGENKIAEESFVQGLKNGICRKYYPTGELLEESLWKENRKEGKYQAFYPTGKPFLQCMYSADQRNGRCFSYFPSGMPEVESQYKDDQPEGTWKYLDENGNIRFTLLFEKGILKNPEVLDSLGSKALEELEKQKGKLDDPEKYLQNPEEYMMRKR